MEKNNAKKFATKVFAISLVGFASMTASAQSTSFCQTYGDNVYCSDGSIGQVYGDISVYSSGEIGNTYGSTTYYTGSSQYYSDTGETRYTYCNSYAGVKYCN